MRLPKTGHEKTITAFSIAYMSDGEQIIIKEQSQIPGVSATKAKQNKGKGKQKYKWILSESIWRTAHFDANCMKIGFSFSRDCDFFIFKMPANVGRHFEINIKTENY